MQWAPYDSHCIQWTKIAFVHFEKLHRSYYSIFLVTFFPLLSGQRILSFVQSIGLPLFSFSTLFQWIFLFLALLLSSAPCTHSSVSLCGGVFSLPSTLVRCFHCVGAGLAVHYSEKRGGSVVRFFNEGLRRFHVYVYMYTCERVSAGERATLFFGEPSETEEDIRGFEGERQRRVESAREV